MQHRRSIRLPEYDYRERGAYFVTVCTHERRHLFGEVVGDELRLNEVGQVVAACWDGIPQHFADVELDLFVVMPNHVLGIVVLTGNPAPSASAFEDSHGESTVAIQTGARASAGSEGENDKARTARDGAGGGVGATVSEAGEG